MDVFSLTFPFQINCVARLRFSSCCSIFHKLGTGRNVTVHLGWWILIGSNDPADGTAVRSQWHHPSSASPWWHINSSWVGQRLGNKTDFRWLFSKKKSKPLTRQQLWGMWILSLCFWKKYNLTLNHSRFVCFLCQLENASTSSVAHWVYFCHHKARGFLHSHTISFKPLSVRVMSLLYQH